MEGALRRRTLPQRSGRAIPSPPACSSLPPPSTARRAARHHTRMAILVVDDDQAVRDALRRALTVQGYTVETAADGREALDLLDGNGSSIDLAIVDVLMPRVDG